MAHFKIMKLILLVKCIIFSLLSLTLRKNILNFLKKLLKHTIVLPGANKQNFKDILLTYSK